MGTTVSTETSTIINIEGTPTLSPTTTPNKILDGNNGNNTGGNSSNTSNTGGTPTVTPTGDSSLTPTVTPGTTTSSTSTDTSTPTVTPDRIFDGNNGSNTETTPIVTPGTTTSSTSTVTFTPTPIITPIILDGNNGSNTFVVTEQPQNTTTTSKTPSFTRLPGIHRYFPNYTNKSDTEISSDILALQKIGIIPIATKANEIYYNAQELIVYYAYYINDNELSYTSNYEFESIDDAVNGAKSYINQIEGRYGESFSIGILYKEDYIYQTNYIKSQVTEQTPSTTTTSQPSTTPTTTLSTDIYFTEMPIYVKMIDGVGNEISNTLPITFDITCNGYSRSITLTGSGTLSGYHPYDNDIIESFSISCSPGKMYYKENGNYVIMPKITSYNQFNNYYHKGGAIYIIGEDILATTSSTPSTSPTTTPTVVKPTSIPPIKVYSDDNKQYSGDTYLIYKATGAVYESDIVMSLPRILTPAYDNSHFVFSSKYDWYYMKNGEKIEIKAGIEHEISLSVLASTSIYIKVSSMTSTSSTSTVTETTTVPAGNNQSVTISSTEPATTQTPPPLPTSTSTKQAKTVRYGFMWN